MKKAWGISTALGTEGYAKVKHVPDGGNALVVRFLQGLISVEIGFGARWKLESPFTAIPLCVSFSFGKNNFVFIPLMLMEHVELIQ